LHQKNHVALAISVLPAGKKLDEKEHSSFQQASHYRLVQDRVVHRGKSPERQGLQRLDFPVPMPPDNMDLPSGFPSIHSNNSTWFVGLQIAPRKRWHGRPWRARKV
jgi:hypothetical protein